VPPIPLRILFASIQVFEVFQPPTQNQARVPLYLPARARQTHGVLQAVVCIEAATRDLGYRYSQPCCLYCQEWTGGKPCGWGCSSSFWELQHFQRWSELRESRERGDMIWC
jgi:hypothetical protein